MKKRLIFVLSFAVLFGYFLHSCMDESDDWSLENEEEQLIEKAKSMYFGSITEDGFIEMKQQSSSMRNRGLRSENEDANGENEGNYAVKPAWEYSRIERDKACQVVEILIQMEQGFDFVMPESSEQFQDSKNNLYIQSKTSLIYLTHKETGMQEMFLMTIIPDFSYIESTKFEPFKKMSYLKRDKKFNGSIFYHDMNGEFVHGWRYADGIVSGAIRVDEENTDSGLLRSGNCTTFYYYTYSEFCWQIGTYYSGETIWGDIQCTTYDYHLNYLTLCDYYGGGGGSGGGYEGNGGGGGSGSSGDPPSPTPRNDCPTSAATNSTTVNNVLNDENTDYAKVKPYMNQLRGYASSQSNEWGLSVHYLSGQYYVFDRNTNPNNPNYFNSGTPNNVGIEYSDYIYLAAHTHPSGTNPAPSPSDAIFLANAYKEGATNITANVAFGSNGSEYMVFVSSRNALSAFCNNSGNSQFFTSSNGMFVAGTKWANDYNSVYNQLISQGFSQNDAQSYALSFVLDKYDTGLKIYEKKSGNFKEQKTETSGNNYSPKVCQ